MVNYSKNKTAQVTYDSEAEYGYLYLIPPCTQYVVKTEELEINPDILLDFDENNHIIGLEIRGETITKLKNWVGKNHIFSKPITNNGQWYFCFRISNLHSKKSFSVNNTKIVFHFSDNNYKEFLGLDIYDIEFYSESFLTNSI